MGVEVQEYGIIILTTHSLADINTFPSADSALRSTLLLLPLRPM